MITITSKVNYEATNRKLSDRIRQISRENAVGEKLTANARFLASIFFINLFGGLISCRYIKKQGDEVEAIGITTNQESLKSWLLDPELDDKTIQTAIDRLIKFGIIKKDKAPKGNSHNQLYLLDMSLIDFYQDEKK